MINQSVTMSMAKSPTPHGQERLATQLEREDVRQTIEKRVLEKQAEFLGSQVKSSPGTYPQQDKLNRFLLCALVSESSRQIKISAQNAGATLPMSVIVRGVLRSYHLAAADKSGPLAGSTFDSSGLRRLNEGVLRCEIARHTRDRVKNSEARLARAQQLGDGEKLKAEREGLEQAIEYRNRVSGKLFDAK